MSEVAESGNAWTSPAVPSAVREMRGRASAFAAATGASEEVSYGVALAVTEIVTNVVLHAYTGTEPGVVTMRCRAEDDCLVVEVADEGRGIAPRNDSPGVGQGLAMVGALARALQIAPRDDGAGTVVTMSFSAAALPPHGGGFERLCALALETIADVSCVDIVSGGVLRRASAEVAGDPALTTWLLGALPPAKPGTATWTAMREGGARLVVHDPTVPRSPGGTGERLGLRWWVAVPLKASAKQPAALWGLGGRDGGHPVPSEDELRALADAAGRDLSEEAQLAELTLRLRAG